MNYFLAKTEPTTYSIDDLAREKSTTWDGVKNPQALQAIRSMSPGDRIFIYHSGKEPAVVGLAEVKSAPRPDAKDSKLTVVEIRYVTHLEPPVPLAEIRQSGQFDDWALLRQGRLSTMAAPQEFVSWVRKRYKSVSI
jgi:predicted RNA-binding protein with PUA-like domain